MFCEDGAFDADEARTVLTAGMAAGLLPRIHANQLGHGPGVQLASSWAPRPPTTAPISPTPTSTRWPARAPWPGCCPGVEFSTRQPYPDARRLLDAGVTVVARHRLQPGQLLHVLDAVLHRARGARDGHVSRCEALLSATRAAPRSLRRDDIGHLRVGAGADHVVLDAPSYVHLAYRPGVPLVVPPGLQNLA